MVRLVDRQGLFGGKAGRTVFAQKRLLPGVGLGVDSEGTSGCIGFVADVAYHPDGGLVAEAMAVSIGLLGKRKTTFLAQKRLGTAMDVLVGLQIALRGVRFVA